EKVARLLRREGLELLERAELAAHTKQRRRPRGDVEVGGVFGGDALQERVDGEGLRRHASELSAAGVARFREPAGNHSVEGDHEGEAGRPPPRRVSRGGGESLGGGGRAVASAADRGRVWVTRLKENCMHSLRQRLNARDESGFTLIELLVVLIIIGVL